ncbi:MAG: hypothetical protein AB7T48_01835 [Solirubrobacterales bacterium]
MAIAYQDETLAGRAAEELDRCAAELVVDPDAASVATCGRDGRVRLTTSHRDGASSHWSEFWGALLDAVLSPSDEASALGGDFPLRLRQALTPGTSALLMALAEEREAAVLDVLSPLDGERITCPLPADPPRRGGDGFHFRN